MLRESHAKSTYEIPIIMRARIHSKYSNIKSLLDGQYHFRVISLWEILMSLSTPIPFSISILQALAFEKMFMFQGYVSLAAKGMWIRCPQFHTHMYTCCGLIFELYIAVHMILFSLPMYVCDKKSRSFKFTE